jgi:hypothetical protein
MPQRLAYFFPMQTGVSCKGQQRREGPGNATPEQLAGI